MPWGLHDRTVEVERYEEFDPFRDSVAEALDPAGLVVGHVATSVSVSWALVGWRWWRPRWGRPCEVLDVLFTPVDARSSDDVIHDVENADWDGTSIFVRGRHHQLRWLSGTDAAHAWRLYGWDREDVPTPPDRPPSTR